jgi:thiol:disulfide interchange protein DsbD
VTAQMLADTTAIEPGKPFTVGVKLKMAPDWHVYWINCGDTGIPTKTTLKLPEGFTASDVQFPIPHKFDVPGGLTAYGYEDQVMFLATVTPPKDLKEGTEIPISARAFWLVCDKDACVQGNATVELKLSCSAKPQAANAAEFEKWRDQLPKTTDQVHQDIQVDAPDGPFKSASGKLTMTWPQTPEKVEWFPAPPDQLTVSSSDVKTENGKSVVTFKVDALPGEKVTNPSIFSVLVYTVNGKRVGVAVPIELRASSPK